MKRWPARMKSWLYHGLAFAGAALSVGWVRWHERRVLREGEPLSGEGRAIAAQLKIHAPDRVRILAVERIPNPLRGVMEPLRRWGAAPFDAVGITFGYAIYVRDPWKDDLALYAHELVHVRQYEAMRSRFRFLKRYIYECLAYGYLNAPLEHEARDGAEGVGF